MSKPQRDKIFYATCKAFDLLYQIVFYDLFFSYL